MTLKIGNSKISEKFFFNADTRKSNAKKRRFIKENICDHLRTICDNLRSGKGFTLMEVMTATCVLSLGTVLIYESFFITLNSFNYYSNYLNVASWMDERIWQAQDNLSRQGLSSQIDATGQFLNRNKNFRWDLSYNLISETQNLYQIDLTLSWQEGRRFVKLLRSTYAMYEPR